MPKRELPLKSLWDEEILGGYLKPLHYVKMYNWLIHSTESKGLETPLEDIPWDRFFSMGLGVKGAAIARDLSMCTTKVVERLDSSRGDSTKLLIELQDGHRIETVVMRHPNHSTVCVSSQIGCKMGCRFCATGTMGIIGDLTSGEIIEQFMHASKVAKIRNVVFMGMGEPLNNFENVKRSVLFLSDNKRFGLSPRQITVSTVGVLHNMRRLSDELPLVNMALSLHAPSQSVRIKIVPAARAHHIDKLLEAIDYHISRDKKLARLLESGNRRTSNSNSNSSHGSSSGKRSAEAPSAPGDDDDADIQSSASEPTYGYGPGGPRRNMHISGVMIEYILIKDINDREEHAHELGRLLGPRTAFVLLNLIPYNPTSVAEDYEPPTDEAVRRFYDICTAAPYLLHTRVRGEKGQDIEAACGQLALVKPGEGRSRAVSIDVEDLGTNGRKIESAAAANRPRGSKVKSAAGAGRHSTEGDNTSSTKWMSMGLWLGLPALAVALSLRRR